MKRAYCIVSLLLGSILVGVSAETFTYIDLIKRLTDLEALSLVPPAGERGAQWSSYDRKSRYDEASGKYVGWDANGDGNGIIRREGDQLVFAEMEGPGCIWRIWSAAPGQGHVKIYLDGAVEPAVDLPFMGYFDLKNEPFTRPAIVHTVARGWNNYTPIPYQKSCKIVADAKWGNYYHFNYTTFPAGTVVPTFKRQLTAPEAAALDEADRILANGGPFRPSQPGESVEKMDLAINGGGKSGITLDRPAAITTLRAKVDGLPPSPEDRNALRELTLQISWDGEETPSVWAPFGDFFGTAAGANPYRSLPSGLSQDGWWYSHWYMPFERQAKIFVQNDSQTERKIHLEVVHVPLKGDASRYCRFHAKWHRDILLPKEPERAIDWTMLQTEGKGRWLGVMLHIWNPRGGWWGEGDEKFFVDGEKFPSTIGTGSEDYFGYAWGDPKLFQNAYHNQTISMNNKGHICVNRWHVTDNVPFEKSFEGAIEKYFANSRPTLFASTVYWYLTPGGKDPYLPLPLSERIGYWTEPTSLRIKGTLEGESLKVLSKTGGNPHEQPLEMGQWSNDTHLWWTGAKPGDKLELAIPVEKAGRYKLSLQLTKAQDYGIVQLSLDGQKLNDPVDLFNRGVIPTGPLAFGIRELAAGQHKLGVEILGANPAAVKAYMFGLDYIKLEPVP